MKLSASIVREKSSISPRTAFIVSLSASGKNTTSRIVLDGEHVEKVEIGVIQIVFVVGHGNASFRVGAVNGDAAFPPASRTQHKEQNKGRGRGRIGDRWQSPHLSVTHGNF